MYQNFYHHITFNYYTIHYDLFIHKHIKKLYTLNEKKATENYIRVSNILNPFSGLDKINPEVLAHAADRGTRVHRICESIIIGLGEFDVEEETRPYIESFKKWWEKGHDVIMVEERFWDDDLKITGQVDLIIKTQDGLAIVDLKTSSRPSKTWPAQGSAYAYLAKKAKHDIKKIYFLHLLKTGKEAKVYEYPIDDGFFFAILRIWEHFYKTR